MRGELLWVKLWGMVDELNMYKSVFHSIPSLTLISFRECFHKIWKIILRIILKIRIYLCILVNLMTMQQLEKAIASSNSLHSKLGRKKYMPAAVSLSDNMDHVTGSRDSKVIEK